ncbi:LysE family translocator [Rhizobiales bacterium]|uniref:LysE family translocator n=1 Tax=Hongsoonwoonella zoysiae TaxID=2821844 RepID=UPI0015608C6E|nr:LysE family translocator [Hongsoonwoonella zoysiae]NRG18398.1 LysE family translocator [Hongsoonwoonella zoysiae]
MPLDQFILLCLFVVVLVGTPGPANMSLMACGLTFGVRGSLPYLLGTLAGRQVMFCANIAGLFALLQGAPVIWDGLRYLCIAYIAWLAWKIVLSRPKSAEAKDVPGFWRGFWVHPLNPKAYATQIAAIAQFVSPERYFSDVLILGLVIALLGGALNAGWLAGGNLLARITQNPRVLLAVNVTLAVLMVTSTIASLRLA